jgi:PAS domain S-box-containing protein
VRELPELFDRDVQARSLAYLFTAGVLVGVLTLVFPHGEDVRATQLVVVTGIAAAIAAVVWRRRERFATWELHLALGIGTVLLTFANYYVGSGALYPVLYSWIALFAFYFFELRVALAHVALIALAYTVLLVIQDPGSPLVRWLLALGTPTLAGLLIRRLLDGVRGEAVHGAQQTRALRQSEARTRMILDSAPDAFIAMDGDGLVNRWNQAAERMFGWSASEAVGQPLRGLVFPPEGREGHDARRREMLANPDPVTVMRVELELQRRDGALFPVDETISRVRLGDEVVVSAFVRDVSERRRRQEEREALLSEQAARAEAERVAEMVSGMQLLVDAALAHRGLDDILTDLVPRVQGVLEADAATIFFVEEGGLVVGASSVADESGGESATQLGEGFAGRVAAERRPLLARDPPPADQLEPVLRAVEMDSLMGVPLLAGGQVTGVIVVSALEPRRFTEEDLLQLGLAADRVALAIDHARVYEREHRIAETLQRSLLPERLPQLPGLAVAARYQPAATEAEVGGDWYDVISIPAGRVGLVMGDVAGKGLAAASMVGRLRSALRAYALEGHDPPAVVEQLNRLVWTELEESQMATLLYVVLDPAEGTVSWVNAGHLPPLLVVGERIPHFLEGGRSVPLGVLPFPSFEEVTVRLEPGGTIVLYTDGLVERSGEHLDQGLERLAQVVREAPASPDALCDHVLLTMLPEGGVQDDVALLALQNTPIEDRFRVELPTQPEALASMRGLLRRWLRHAQGTEQEIAEITTACGEAATNAIEHAGASGDTPFEVDGELLGREIDISVRDFGVWRPPRDGDQGRGLSLMRALMDSVEVTPSGEGTTVRLRRTLIAEAEAEAEGDGRPA